MGFIEISGERGLLYVPDRRPGRSKHDCPDCYACQHCSDDRCGRCRGGGEHRPQPGSTADDQGPPSRG